MRLFLLLCTFLHFHFLLFLWQFGWDSGRDRDRTRTGTRTGTRDSAQKEKAISKALSRKKNIPLIISISVSSSPSYVLVPCMLSCMPSIVPVCCSGGNMPVCACVLPTTVMYLLGGVTGPCVPGWREGCHAFCLPHCLQCPSLLMGGGGSPCL